MIIKKRDLVANKVSGDTVSLSFAHFLYIF